MQQISLIIFQTRHNFVFLTHGAFCPGKSLKDLQQSLGRHNPIHSDDSHDDDDSSEEEDSNQTSTSESEYNNKVTIYILC